MLECTKALTNQLEQDSWAALVKTKPLAGLLCGSSSPASAPLGPLCGQRVTLAGLVARPELNGHAACVRSFDAASGRYVVELGGDPTVALDVVVHGEMLRVREQNLRAVASHSNIEEQD